MSDNTNNGFPVPEKPLTREEEYLSAIAQVTASTEIPEKPLTRVEAYLDKIVENGGGGGGGGFTPTQEQLDAMNSGITSEDVEQISTNQNNILMLNQYSGAYTIYDVNGTIVDDKLGSKTKTSTGYTVVSNGVWSYMTQRITLPNPGRYIFSFIISNFNSSETYNPSIILTKTQTITRPYLNEISIKGNGNFTVEFEIDTTDLYITFYANRSSNTSSTSSFTADKIMICPVSEWQNAEQTIYGSINMFGSIAAIGDSYTAGLCINSSNNQVTATNQSYIATIGKRNGIDWYNYGVSGATAKTYITNADGLPKVLNATAHDFYIIALGINDINTGSTKGTISDIHDDYTQNPDTFYGNMGRILSQLISHAPNARIVLVKSFLNTNKYNTDISYQSFDDAIAEIAAHFQIQCIAPFDDVYFNSMLYQNYRIQGHPTAMGYAGMGVAIERLLSHNIVANPTYYQYSTIG